jgi:hypothetical protein
MLELLPAVGEPPLYNAVWDAMKMSLSGQAQTGRMVLVTGTSGMGKTKTAYDVGMQHEACVIIMRVCERDSATKPWEACFRFIRELLHTAPRGQDSHNAQVERETIKTVLLYLIAAHLEWVVDICEALAKEVTVGTITPQQLREVILRAQRNGLAYQSICTRFCRLIHLQMEALGVDQVSICVALRPEDATTHLQGLVARARCSWDHFAASSMALVFAYDEVQALLDGKLHHLGAEVCRGIYHSPIHPTDAVDAPHAASQGLFYGFWLPCGL